ncbi:unnamed protein product [Schistosoma curassoni]|uniref:Uncharacterized protein n=1 Tax=Schistosoma curassoni TaxID=6186 RepID=A0A3P8D4P5_9TREM|nr:unnamed protein product [Schistosoma curassoni]
MLRIQFVFQCPIFYFIFSSVYLNSVDGGVISKGSLTPGTGRNSVELGNSASTNDGTRQSGCAC